MVRILYYIFISLFVFGCASSSGVVKTPHKNAESVQNDRAVTSSKSTESAPVSEIHKDKFTLLVLSDPKGSRIRIMNIKPKYKDNIILKRGKYLIEVSKSGYETYKKWIFLDRDKTLHVKLKKIKYPVVSYNGLAVWKKEPLEDKFKKYSVYTLMDSLKSSFDNGNLLWLDDKISKARGMKWDVANNYCKNLKLHGLKWRLPTCKEAKRYIDNMEKHLLYHTYVATWANKKDYLYYSGCSLEKDGDSYYWQFDCVSKIDPKIKKYSLGTIVSLILRDFKNISKKEAYKKALSIKFGNPKIENIKYDSKSGVLSFDLVSSRLDDIGLANRKIKLKNALTSKNGKRIKENIQVYNLKDESIIVIDTNYIYRHHFKAFDLSKIKNLKYLIFKNYIFDDSLHYASFFIRTMDYRPIKKYRIFIVVDRITSDRYELGDFLRLPDNGMNYARGEATLYIDPNVKVNLKHKKRYRFKKRLKMKVSPRYVKDMISLITSEDFNPTVVFGVENGKLRFKYIKELSNKENYIENERFKKVYYDIEALRKFIKKYPDSRYADEAKRRIEEIKRLYKGYEPKELYKVQGCVGYLPTALITKNIEKIGMKPSFVKSENFKSVTWSGLCRRGLLSGRGYMKMVSKDGNFIVEIKGKMKDGFFLGNVKRNIKRITKRLSSTSYRFVYDELKENIKLNSKSDYERYQKESR